MDAEELLALERRGWAALCDGTSAEFYGSLMTDDGVMVLANGAVLDRAAAVASLRGSPVWQRFEIDDVRVVGAGVEATVLVYTGRAWRDAGAPPFTAVMSSTYVRSGGDWRLALYTQTPLH